MMQGNGGQGNQSVENRGNNSSNSSLKSKKQNRTATRSTGVATNTLQKNTNTKFNQKKEDFDFFNEEARPDSKFDI